MRSLWTATTELPQFQPQLGNTKTDVLVIGGGMTGLLCTYYLKRAGMDCLLVEGDTICHGTTGNTTAKITAQHGLIYNRLIRRFGLEGAGQYLKANLAAVEEYRLLCGDIPCGYEHAPAVVYSTENRKKLEEEVHALRRLGYPARLVEKLPLPFPTVGGVEFPHQAQFHPLEFAAALASGLPIREHTKVQELRGYEAVTEGGTIRAKAIVVATHFPFLNKHGLFSAKLYQRRSYVLALEGVPPLSGMYLDEREGGLSLRSAEGLVLLGGGGHRTGKPGGGWNELRKAAKQYYPQSKEVYHWAAQDCMSLDGMPYIGTYSKATPRLYVATGFNKWGMTSAMVAAKLLTDLVLERETPYAKLFRPDRTMLRPQLVVNGLESTVNLLTPTTPRCPHLGCALKWNQQEHSWDCPCHGSRFSKEGQVLDNPANDDLKERPPRGRK